MHFFPSVQIQNILHDTYPAGYTGHATWAAQQSFQDSRINNKENDEFLERKSSNQTEYEHRL